MDGGGEKEYGGTTHPGVASYPETEADISSVIVYGRKVIAICGAEPAL